MRKAVIGALTIGVLLVMGALRATDLWSFRADTLKLEESRAANLALILSEYVAEAFVGGDAALRQLALHNRRIGGVGASDEEWTPNLAAARAGLAGIGAISVIDREGVVRHSTRREIVGASRADNYIVREALKGPADTLVVGTPFRAIVEPFSYLIPIARPLTRRDGSIEGAVVASFVPAELGRFFQRLDVGRNGVVWVFHLDGAVLFREPSSSIAIGQSAKSNVIFQTALQRQSGTLREAVEDSGPVMLTAFRTTASPRMIVAVSLSAEDLLANWRREAVMGAATFVSAMVLLGATLLVLFRQMDAKTAAEAALERTRAEESERLRAANDELAATLQREQNARKEAEAASALKDQFLMTVSHELRTPLTAIAGWARMLVDGMVSDSSRDRALQSIERNAQTQTRLIEDLLDVSSVMTGKLRLHVRTVEVLEMVRAAIEAIAPAAAAKSITIDTSLDLSAGSITGDPERLQQIAWNLLSNAVKFTPPGGHVNVAVVKLENEVGITVTDTGAGITAEFLPHVFEHFRQADGSPARRHGGLGLGLAIVRSLTELHGGSVTAHSDGENQGATFTVRLPAPIRRRA